LNRWKLSNSCSFGKKSGIHGESPVWKETYPAGPLPDTGLLHIFRISRAEYLSHFAELSGSTAEKIYQHLQGDEVEKLSIDAIVIHCSGISC
jgi:hypothetical protein